MFEMKERRNNKWLEEEEWKRAGKLLTNYVKLMKDIGKTSSGYISGY